MLAKSVKDMKIKTLKRQREFIESQLALCDTREDGNTSYIYVGHVYPENIAFFESQGFIVTKIESDSLTAINRGLSTYVFVVGNIELTEEEINQAEKTDEQKAFEDLIDKLFDGYDY